MTPYEIHTELGHDETVHSPNGMDHISECEKCGLKWLFKSNESPITIYPICRNKADGGTIND